MFKCCFSVFLVWSEKKNKLKKEENNNIITLMLACVLALPSV